MINWKLLKLFLLFSLSIGLYSTYSALQRKCNKKYFRFQRPPQTATLLSNTLNWSCCLLTADFSLWKGFKLELSQMSSKDLREWLHSAQKKYFAISDELLFAWRNTAGQRERINSQFWTVYEAVPRADLIATAMGTLSVAWFVRRSLHRYKNTNDLPLQFFEKQKKLSGLAVTVNDSDNLRFYHQPNWLFSLLKPNLARQDLKYHTINVRLAGIDAPEMAHFGTKPQPYAVEAKEWLTNFVQGRRVKIQLLRIDQYGRAVAMVWVHRRRFPFFFWPVWWNVSLEMVQAGFATIYRDAGAEYGNIKDKLLAAEQRAKKQRIGMWKQSSSEYQSPGDFKRLNRLNAALNTLKNNGLIAENHSHDHRKVDFISNKLKSVSVGGK